MGTREGDRVTVVPVAEIQGDSLLPLELHRGPDFIGPFVRTRLARGTAMDLFAGGERVGTVEVEEVAADSASCHPRPAASGTARLLPSAASLTRFLALARSDEGPGSFGVPRLLEDTYPDRAASVGLTVDAMGAQGARWPRGELVNYRVALQVMELGRGGPRAFASTFLVGDTPRVGPADASAWALFTLGIQTGEDDYRPAWSWYREVGEDGKGVPLYFQHGDWDGDGEPEVLLEVVGAEHRWTAALARQGTEWARIYLGPCDPSREAPASGGEPSP
jgi:hypothetical protein